MAPGRGVGHRLPRRPNVIHPLRFGVEVPDVAVMGSSRQRHHRVDHGAGGAQTDHLAGIVGEQANRTDAELGEHRRRFGVVARVHGEAEGNVGIDGVGAAVLGDVGAELVHQSDSSAFVTGCIDQDATPLGGDHPEPGSQLDTAVAP